MEIKRFLTLFILFLVFIMNLTILSPVQAAKVRIDLNNTMTPGGSEEASMKLFKKLVEERSKEEMEVHLFMAGQLGGEQEVLELLQIGQTDMSLTGGIYKGMYAKEYDAILVPFLFSSMEEVECYFATPSGQKIKELALKRGGIVVFTPQYRAPRNMASNRAVNRPDDLKGLKIRLPSISLWIDAWQELGALPTPIPAQEIYMALQTGVVAAHENPIGTFYNRKMWEVQKYVIMTEHAFSPWEWIFSNIKWNKLTPEQQKIVREAVEEARKHGAKVEKEKDSFYMESLKKEGMKIIYPDRKLFREKAKPAVDRALKTLAPGVREDVEKCFGKGK